MKALVEAGTPAITIVGKSWDLHVHESWASRSTRTCG